MSNSVRLMQFLLLVSSVVSCFVALFPHSSALTLGIEVFLIGSFQSPILPCIIGWLELQRTVSWSEMTLGYGVAVSVGRGIIPYVAAVLILRHSSFTCFFYYVSAVLAVALLVLLMLTRCVRNVARLIAVEQLSDTLMESEAAEDNESSRAPSKKARKGGYMKLAEKDEELDFEVIASDEECEDDL